MFGIEKCGMLVTRCGKRHMADGMEETNQEKLERTDKRKPRNYF